MKSVPSSMICWDDESTFPVAADITCIQIPVLWLLNYSSARFTLHSVDNRSMIHVGSTKIVDCEVTN